MTKTEAITELVRIWHSPHLDLILKARLGEVIEVLKGGDDECEGARMAMSSIVRCKDCKNRGSDACPMFFEEWFTSDEGDGYVDDDYRIHDYTESDGYCHWGERREDGES